MKKQFVARITGFAISLLLTLVAYFIILNPHFFDLGTGGAVIVIYILAVFQFIAQFIFFIHIWREKGPPWNLSVFISTVFIVITIIFFSIWIMNNLNYNMMPWMAPT